jgi:pilus assembly protein CpaC
MSTRDKRGVWVVWACTIVLFIACARAPCHAVSLGGTLRLSLGQQQVLEVPAPLEQVAIGDPAVVDVKIISQGRQVLVTATGKGTTDLITWDVEGKQTTTLVSVILKDIRLIQREIEGMVGSVEGVAIRLVGERVVVDGEVFTKRDMERIEKVSSVYPDEVTLLVRMSPSVSRLLASEITRSMEENGYPDVRAVGIGDKIFLEGTVSRKEDKKQVLSLAEAYFSPCVNMVRMAGRVEDLVLIDIRFVEVGKNLLEKIGVNWDDTARFEVTSLDYVSGMLRDSSQGLSTGGGRGISNNIAINRGSTSDGGVEVTGLENSGANVNLLESNAFARTLAHPKLVCKSGEKANFLAGGEIPIVLALTDRFAVEYKDYGIILNISPLVHTDGRISAGVEAESSALDWANAVQGYPALKKRSVDTYVTLEKGKILALSGLVNSKDAKDVERVPVLGKFPVIGELFKSRGFGNEDTELVIFLSTSLMLPGDQESEKMIRSVEDRYKKGDELLKPNLFD